MNSAQHASPPQVGGVGNEHTREKGTVGGPGGGPSQDFPVPISKVLAGWSMLIGDTGRGGARDARSPGQNKIKQVPSLEDLLGV